MKPLENHVELSSHVWMFNRLRELLMREGLLNAQAGNEELRTAIDEWLKMVAKARKEESVH